MTDRFNSITVVLETDMREDDAESIIIAIQQMRGVLKATGNVRDITSHVAEERAKRKYWNKLLEAMRDDG